MRMFFNMAINTQRDYVETVCPFIALVMVIVTGLISASAFESLNAGHPFHANLVLNCFVGSLFLGPQKHCFSVVFPFRFVSCCFVREVPSNRIGDSIRSNSWIGIVALAPFIMRALSTLVSVGLALEWAKRSILFDFFTSPALNHDDNITISPIGLSS